MPFPTVTTWKNETSRWWASRSANLKGVDDALAAFHANKTHDNFVALAAAMKKWMESKDDWAKSTRNTGANAGVVTRLVDEIAQSEYWRGVRGSTPMAVTAGFFRTYATAAPNSFNREFLEDAAGFLSRYSVYCYNVERTEHLDTYGLTDTALGGRQALNFEFVKEEKSGTSVSLKVVPAGRGGTDQIAGGWIPYRGQSASPDPSLFGHLAILSAEYAYIFTVGLGGCRIAVARDSGVIHMYHEPTQTRWGRDPAYPGTFLGYYHPDYERVLAGFTCFERHGGTWRAHVQEIAVIGGAVERVTTTELGF